MMPPAQSPARALRRRIILSLLLGLTTTILTAWSLVVLAQLPRPARVPSDPTELHYDFGTSPHTSPAGDDYDLTTTVWRRPGALYIQTSLMQGRVRDAIREHLPDRVSPAAECLIPRWAQGPMLPWLRGRAAYPTENTIGDSRAVAARGWPFLALYCSYTHANFRSTPPYHDTIIGGGIPVPIPTRPTAPYTEPAPPSALPLTPIWFGFATNTALYASLWALILFTPGALLARSRRRRGHCPRCGYNIQSNLTAPCPECGLSSNSIFNSPSVASVAPR